MVERPVVTRVRAGSSPATSAQSPDPGRVAGACCAPGRARRIRAPGTCTSVAAGAGAQRLDPPNPRRTIIRARGRGPVSKTDASRFDSCRVGSSDKTPTGVSQVHLGRSTSGSASGDAASRLVYRFSHLVVQAGCNPVAYTACLVRSQGTGRSQKGRRRPGKRRTQGGDPPPHASLAQWSEPPPLKRRAPGSNPGRGTRSPLVQRQDAWLWTRRPRFESLAESRAHAAWLSEVRRGWPCHAARTLGSSPPSAAQANGPMVRPPERRRRALLRNQLAGNRVGVRPPSAPQDDGDDLRHEP